MWRWLRLRLVVCLVLVSWRVGKMGLEPRRMGMWGQLLLRHISIENSCLGRKVSGTHHTSSASESSRTQVRHQI